MAQAQNASPDPMAFAGTANVGASPTNAPMAPSPTAQAPAYTGPAFQPNMPNSPFDPNTPQAPSPLSGLTEAQKDAYWATQGANVNIPGFKDQSAPGYDAALAALKNDPASQALAKSVQGTQATNLANQNAATAAFNSGNAQADWAAYANALNNQQGYAGSGMPYLDPNKPPPGWGITTESGAGMAPTPYTVNNPLSASQQMPVLGQITSSGTQDKPTSQGGTVTPMSLGLQPPTGPASDVGGGIPPNPPSATVASGAPGAGGVSLSPINPDDSLISKTIAPGPGVDRVKTFQNALDSTIQNELDPAYQSRAKTLNRYNFGAGRGVSGIARTSQGDVASDYGRQIKDLAAQGLNTATIGSIDDMYKNLGLAERQQQFQKGESDTAFDQAVRQAQLEEDLTNGAFGRSAATSAAGEANSPANIALILSQIFGGQSSAAGDAAAKLFGAMGNKSGSGGSGSGIDLASIINYIKSIGGGGGNPSGGYVDTPPNNGTAVV